MQSKLNIFNSNKFAIVDSEDYALLSRYKWSLNQKGHVKTSFYLNGKQHTLLLHRLIMNPVGSQQVDHINRDKLDNRKENLRIVTAKENAWNRNHYNFKQTSRFKGVQYLENRNKYKAYISHDNKRYHLGYFDDEISAAKAYNDKAIELRGEYAVLNHITGSDE